MSGPAISPAFWRSDADLALDVIGDLLTESAFDPEELEREKNVIVQEIGAVEDTPDDLVFDLLTATAWPDQPIGRPILGTREGVEAFDRAAIDAIWAAATAPAPPSSPPPARSNTIISSLSLSLASERSPPRRRRPKREPLIAAARSR